MKKVEGHARIGKRRHREVSYVSQEQRIPANHPPRPIGKMVGEILDWLSPRWDELYYKAGQPSIPSAGLLKALLL